MKLEANTFCAVKLIQLAYYRHQFFTPPLVGGEVTLSNHLSGLDVFQLDFSRYITYIGSRGHFQPPLNADNLQYKLQQTIRAHTRCFVLPT